MRIQRVNYPEGVYQDEAKFRKQILDELYNDPLGDEVNLLLVLIQTILGNNIREEAKPHKRENCSEKGEEIFS